MANLQNSKINTLVSKSGTELKYSFIILSQLQLTAMFFD
jgi:hypothetical protein